MQLDTGAVVDRYTIEGLLGQGGMAVVYRARHNQLGTLHAIKVLLVSTPSIRARLLQEGRVQAQLRHPNIVSVTDVIDIQGAPGLVMELIQGISLEQLLQKQPLTLAQADELAKGILAGVAEAHRHGVLHRDLKPGNVMLQMTLGGLVPKVTDFGLAKAMTAEETGGPATRSGVTMGTPCFMSPEQIRDAKNTDRRADVFSLGAILYELATNRRAFDQPDVLAIFNAVATGSFVPPRSIVPDLPDRMEAAILGALVVDREARIPDCEALLAAWSGQAPSASAAAPAGPWSDDLLRSVTDEVSRSMVASPPPRTTPTWGDVSLAPASPPSVAAPGTEVLGSSADFRKAPRWGGGAALVAAGVVALLMIGAGAALFVFGVGTTVWLSTAEGEVAPSPEGAPAAEAPAPPSPEVPIEAEPPAPPSPEVPIEAEPPAPSSPEVVPPVAQETAAPRPSTKPVPAESPKAEPPPAPKAAGVEVAVTGDATEVVLTRDGRDFRVPGAVPPGNYTVRATFPASPPVIAGSVTVVDGAPLTVSCGAAFQKCKGR